MKVVNVPYLVMVQCFDDIKRECEEHYFPSVEDADDFWEFYQSTHEKYRMYKYVLPLVKFRKRRFHEIRCQPVPADWGTCVIKDD